MILVGNKKIFPIRSGFTKWQIGGKKINLLHEVSDLHTFGLELLQDRTFKTEKDGFYGLSFVQPYIFISEELS